MYLPKSGPFQIRTPLGQKRMSFSVRCPHFREYLGCENDVLFRDMSLCALERFCCIARIYTVVLVIGLDCSHTEQQWSMETTYTSTHHVVSVTVAPLLV